MKSKEGPSPRRRGKAADRPRRGRGTAGSSTRQDEIDDVEGDPPDEGGPGEIIMDAAEFFQALWDRGDRESIDDVDVPAIDGSVAAWMAEWRIEAMGNRPRDHMARDLMHAALLRNHRAAWFQSLAKKPPEWLWQAVGHLPDNQRRQAAQHLVLRMMHGRHLHHVSMTAAERGPSMAEFDDLSALLACRPYGALVGWAGAADRAHDFTCGDFRACPWCLARRAVDLHERLRRGPCRPRDGVGKHLLLGRIEITSEGQALRKRDVDRVRLDWGDGLKDWARGCGAVGGLLVHQIGPHRTAGGADGFLHDLAVLAEVPTATARQRSLLRKASGIEQGCQPRLVGHRSSGREWDVPIQAAAMPADNPQALRYLLAGTDAGFEPGLGGIALNRDPAEKEWGLDGAMRLLPWFLFDADRWASYRQAMRGRHLAIPFGTWKGAIPRKPRCDEYIEMLMNRFRSPKQRAAIARNRPLRARNEEVEHAAGEERERAMASARSAYARLIEGKSRAVGRGRLQQAMVEDGHPVSEKVVRDLIRRLRAEFGR